MFKNLSLKVIIFGFIFTFFSSFGQSFFIGLFNTQIRTDLNITHGQFGSIYALATLISSFTFIFVGKMIDDFKLIKFSLFVILVLFLSSTFFSYVNNIYLLIVGIFLLRFSGQGLMSHTATTSISRYFDFNRGKALSVAWLGLSAAEFIMPITIVFFLSLYSWRSIWLSIGLIIILFLPIISFLTIKNITLNSREKNNAKLKRSNIKSWTRKEILLDPKFYLISLVMLALPTINTGVFVYQSFILESKNWGEFVIAKSFMFYAVFSVVTLFISGHLIDKYTSRKILPLMNIPTLFAMIILFYSDNYISSYFLLGLMGVSNGLANVLGSSTWAEIYGVKHIGSIKALTTAMMVFSTAFGTAVFGIIIDLGYSIETIAMMSFVYISGSNILIIIFKSKIKP
ncbi:MAG: putative arabinose efflux permease, MFS family, partial [Pelagibacterales bacterium]|nr:putative arabinose efflux permease, MFS family [Pelagibacterales bacterium]